MGKRTGGGGPAAAKVKGPPRWWCYYCDTRHEGELQLIQHQRHKHFLCRLCDPKSYGRNCLSLSGLISHVRRSHRQEITEVPGAIEGRRSTDVEVSGMNGIPDQALDAFEERLAEEMIQSWPGHQPEAPEDDSEQEEELPPAVKEPIKPTDEKKDLSAAKRQPVVPDMAWIASQLATSDGQYNNLELERPQIQLPGVKEQVKSAEIKAFDPSLLARVQAGSALPSDLEQEREELARQEDEVRARAEEKERRDKEKKRRAVSIAFLPKKDKDAPVVPKVDKSVVGDWGFAIQARAAQAKEARQAASDVKTTTVSLQTKLVAMQPGALLKFAVESGVPKDSIMKANGSKDFITQLILQLEQEESWKMFTFKPGKIGIKADWARGEVESVTAGGQGESLGIKLGWIFKKVETERFCKSTLQEKIAGTQDYQAIFATSEGGLEKSRSAGGGRYKPGGIKRPKPKKKKAPKADAKAKEGAEAEYSYSEGEENEATGEKKPRKKKKRNAEEDHCLPGEEDHCLPGEEEEDHCLPGECEEEPDDKAGGRRAKGRRREEQEPEEERPRGRRRGRESRHEGYEDDGYRQARRQRRGDDRGRGDRGRGDRGRYEYEEEFDEEEEYEEYSIDEEEYQSRRQEERRGRRYEEEGGRGRERGGDRRGGRGRERGRERGEDRREQEYDPEEQEAEKEETPKTEEAPKKDETGRKRLVQRLLPREEKEK